jgi:hypothetical protein
MSNFEVLNIRKIKTMVGCIQVIKHNLRKKINLKEVIDTTKSHMNFYSGATDEDFYKKYKELTSNLQRKIQKNASRLIEFVISLSPECVEGWENNNKLKKRITEYFNAAEIFLKARYGNVIISRTDHFDETTPHTHINTVPICIAENGSRKFSSSEFLGGKKGLFELHDKFYAEVGIHFGLKRGIRESRSKHSSLKHFKEFEKSQKAKLKEKEADLIKNEDLLRKQKQELEAQKKQLFILTSNAMERSVKLKNRELEMEQIEKNQNEQIPQIPVPPAVATENTRKTWRERVQSTIDTTFKKITAVMLSFKAKYDDLLEKHQNLLVQNENNKKRAEKAERDLLEKPIAEIIAIRKPSKQTVPVKDNTNEHNGNHI